MISYKIIFNAGLQQAQSKTPKPGDPNFKELIFERALNGCVFRAGDRFKLRGTSRRGEVVEVVKDINSIVWKANRPYFLKVKMDDNDVQFLAPVGNLRKKR